MADRRWVAADFGGPEVLKQVDVDVPAHGPGEVRFIAASNFIALADGCFDAARQTVDLAIDLRNLGRCSHDLRMGVLPMLALLLVRRLRFG